MEAPGQEMTFEELIKIRNSIGTKQFNAITKRKQPDTESEKPAKKVIKKRTDKNMPQEISSKKPTTRRRNVVDVSKPKFRDPRFEPMSGKLNPDLFERSYGFIHEFESKEIEQLKSDIKKEKDLDKKQEMQSKLNKTISRLNAKKMEERKMAQKREWKKQEAEKVKDGKTPFFVKKCKSFAVCIYHLLVSVKYTPHLITNFS